MRWIVTCLLRNTRKTECGASLFLTPLAVRAAPFALLVGAVWTQIAPPRIGYVLQDGRWQAIYGVRGNFLPGEVVTGNVLSAAFSGSTGLVKTDTAVVVFDENAVEQARLDAPPGPAVFAFDAGGSPALVYFPESHTSWPPIPEGLADPVESAAPLGNGQFAFVIRRGLRLNNDLWLVRPGSEQLLTGVHAPVLLLPGGRLLYSDDREIVIRETTGVERRLPLPASALRLEQIGDGWIHVVTEKAGLALRLTADAEEIFFLPLRNP